MHSIPQSSVQSSSRESKSKQQRSKGSKKEQSIHPSAEQTLIELSEVKPATPKKPSLAGLMRSNSEFRLRDREFYELCVEEEETDQPSNIFEAFYNKKLTQSRA